MTPPIQRALPSGLTRPYSKKHESHCLFRIPLREALTRLSVSDDEMHRWRTSGWLSFNWQPDEWVDEFDDPKVGEIEIIRDISRSGLGDAWITRALKQLPRPISHPAERILFSFQHGWLVHQPPEPVDPTEITKDYISELEENGDHESLTELRQKIEEALEKAKQQHSSTQDHEPT